MRRAWPRDGLCAGSLLLLAALGHAGELSWRAPDAVYVQGGIGDDVASATVGTVWNGLWQRESGWGRWELGLDLSLGRWRVSDAQGADARRDATQLGITPVLRLWVQGSDRFFVEGGIGANWIFPMYRNGDRQFSTSFNFGDHIGAGWRFGATGLHEVTLRLQHFSNAGIKHPNPGENFVQVRYARRF